MLIKHYTSVWWPTSRLVVSGTSYTTTRNFSPWKIFLTKKLQKSQKVAKKPNKNFGANCFLKEPNFWFMAPKEPIWQPWPHLLPPAPCQPSLCTDSSAVTSFSQILWSWVLQREYHVFVSELVVLASHVVHVDCFCCVPSSKHFQPLLLIRSIIQISGSQSGQYRLPGGGEDL